MRKSKMLDDPTVAEVHEARWKLFKEADCDLHVFFQCLREAEKKHPERIVELPCRSSVAASPRIIPYAGKPVQRSRRVPSSNPSGPRE